MSSREYGMAAGDGGGGGARAANMALAAAEDARRSKSGTGSGERFVVFSPVPDGRKASSSVMGSDSECPPPTSWPVRERDLRFRDRALEDEVGGEFELRPREALAVLEEAEEEEEDFFLPPFLEAPFLEPDFFLRDRTERGWTGSTVSFVHGANQGDPL